MLFAGYHIFSGYYGYYDGCFKTVTGLSVVCHIFAFSIWHAPSKNVSIVSRFWHECIWQKIHIPNSPVSRFPAVALCNAPPSLIWLVHYNSFYLLCIVSIIAFCIFSIDIFIQSSDVPLPHCCVLPPHLPLFDFCCWLVHYDSFYVSFASGSFEELYC